MFHVLTHATPPASPGLPVSGGAARADEEVGGCGGLGIFAALAALATAFDEFPVLLNLQIVASGNEIECFADFSFGV